MTFVSVYCIDNLINSKQYIGTAVDHTRRWCEHKSGHGSKILNAAFQKYGVENFSFEVIEILPEDEAKELEILMIRVFETQAPNGYNITLGGEGTIGFKHSKETRQEMSESRVGARNGMYGKTHSKETKEKLKYRALIRQPTVGKCQSRPGSINGRAKPVFVNGKEYGCMKDAALDMGWHPERLRRKFHHYHKTNNWPAGWAYL